MGAAKNCVSLICSGLQGEARRALTFIIRKIGVIVVGENFISLNQCWGASLQYVGCFVLS